MYKYTHFGTVALPSHIVNLPQDPAPARLSYVETVAGGYDTLRGGPAYRDYPHTITPRFDVANDSQADLRELIDTLRASVGQRQLLKRQALDDANEVQVCYARIEGVPHVLAPDNINDVTLSLPLSIETNWYGKAYTDWFTEVDMSPDLDSGQAFGTTSLTATYAGSGTHNLLYINSGTLAVRDPVLKITVGGTDSTNTLTITQSLSDTVYPLISYNFSLAITQTGLLETGDVMVIDAGAQLITVNGTPVDYGDITYGTHEIDNWMTLASTHPYTSYSPTGLNIQVLSGTLTGDSTIELMYVEQWA